MAYSTSLSPPQATSESPRALFAKWLRAFPRTYTSNVAEMERRLAIFTNNVKHILNHNTKGMCR